jgi:type III secretion protein J
MTRNVHSPKTVRLHCAPWVTVGLAVLAVSCSVSVASNLAENDANRVVMALEQRGLAAEKEPDPDSEGRWRVTVARDDASASVIVLATDNLPPPDTPGVLETVGTGSIVPSRTSEHAKLIAGTAGELERTLRSLDGMLSARVHLAVPVGDPLTIGEEKTLPSASVLLRHRGATPPIALGDVQRLVAGAVPGLDPKQVSVIATPSPAPPASTERELVRFGPITVTRSSLLAVRLLVGGAVVLGLAVLAVLVMLWSRLRRVRHAADDARLPA